MSKLIFVIPFLICTLQTGNSARILGIIPTASYSHQMFHQQFWRELAIKGHEVVVITTDPTGEKLPNFREISIKESYKPMREIMNMFIDDNIFNILWHDKMSKHFKSLITHQIELPQVQELIQNKTEHFDLLMVEHYPGAYLAFKHRYNCPLIGVMSMDGMPPSHTVMGNPVHSILYPSAMLPFQENLDFFQRLAAVVLDFMFEQMQQSFRIWSRNLTQVYFGKDTPDIMDLFEESDMLFVNANPLFSPVRPHSPSTINIAGGIHMKPEKPLPKDLKDFLDGAKEGVIYFSLGSNVISKDLSLDLRRIFMETLAQLPYKVLWKFEDDNLPGKPENVKIIKWSPQQDVLRHKNIKLFITQGGLQSLEEALYTNIPLVVMPFMGDQEANGEKVKSKGIGIVLDRFTLTVDKFKNAILEVINNPEYKTKVVTLAKQIQDQPMTPLEKAVWWTEYVLRHKGAKHLRGPRIPFYQYYYLDILAFLSFVIIVLIGILGLIVKLIWKGIKKICCKKSKIDKKQKVKRT